MFSSKYIKWLVKKRRTKLFILLPVLFVVLLFVLKSLVTYFNINGLIDDFEEIKPKGEDLYQQVCNKQYILKKLLQHHVFEYDTAKQYEANLFPSLDSSVFIFSYMFNKEPLEDLNLSLAKRQYDSFLLWDSELFPINKKDILSFDEILKFAKYRAKRGRINLKLGEITKEGLEFLGDAKTIWARGSLIFKSYRDYRKIDDLLEKADMKYKEACSVMKKIKIPEITQEEAAVLSKLNQGLDEILEMIKLNPWPTLEFQLSEKYEK